MPPQLTDFSSITPETIKKQNTNFWRGDTEYDPVQNWDDQVRRKIWNTRNHDLREVVRRFPKDEPLADQCAHWVHAIAGRHFFPDANHRTAIALLRTLLRDNGVTPGKWPVETTRRTSIRSHKVRGEIENVRLDTLYRKDRLFLVWLLYFKEVLRTADD